MNRVNFGQRVVVVIASGIVLYFVGQYMTTLGNPFGVVGWVGYAPLDRAYAPSGYWLTPLECLFVWLGLAALWVVGSVLLLRTPNKSRVNQDDQGEDAKREEAKPSQTR